jgi:hypothetical protein
MITLKEVALPTPVRRWLPGRYQLNGTLTARHPEKPRSEMERIGAGKSSWR